MYGRTSCVLISAAYAVAASWRPASMISNAAPAGMPCGDTFVHVPPPSPVIWMMPLFVAAQITPAFTADAENVVMEAVGCPRVGVCGAAAAAVRSGLISFHVIP